MKINFLNNYYNSTTFCGKKGENQPLTRELRDIFANPEIPQPHKAILWNLSEIDDFCPASKGTSKADLLRLAGLIKNAHTNIYQLALRGDIQFAREENGSPKVSPLIELSQIAKKQKTSQKRSIYDILRDSIIAKLEKIAKEEYEKRNAYPNNIIIDGNGLIESNTSIKQENSDMDLLLLIFNKLFSGNPITQKDKIFIFSKNIKGKNDIPIGYTPTDKSLIEPQMPVIPYNMSLLYRSNLPDNIKKAVYDLSDAPYFSNLVKQTPPEDLPEIIALAALNKEIDGILSKMLRKELQFTLLNPETQETYKVPIIDTEKILLKKKQGNLTETSFKNIIETESIALPICVLYKALKDSIEFQDIKRIGLRKINDELSINFWITDNDGEIKNINITQKQDDIMKYLDTIPFKSLTIDFYNEEE